MADAFTHMNITDVKNVAPDMGFGDVAELRFAKEDYDAERTGFTHHKLGPDLPGGFGHRHFDAEEVYFVLSGSGRMKLDDEIVELSERDVVRVAPEVWRGFSSGPDGLEVLAFGAHHPNDGEVDPQWWAE